MLSNQCCVQFGATPLQANVRSEPYLDETKLGCLDEDKANQFITPLQKKRFFSISYYKG